MSRHITSLTLWARTRARRKRKRERRKRWRLPRRLRMSKCRMHPQWVSYASTCAQRLTRGQPRKKAKKEKEEIVIPLEDLSPIAQPLAQKKLVKKLHKTIKKGGVPMLIPRSCIMIIIWVISLQSQAGQTRRQRGRKGYPQGRARASRSPVSYDARVISLPGCLCSLRT